MSNPEFGICYFLPGGSRSFRYGKKLSCKKISNQRWKLIHKASDNITSEIETNDIKFCNRKWIFCNFSDPNHWSNQLQYYKKNYE